MAVLWCSGLAVLDRNRLVLEVPRVQKRDWGLLQELGCRGELALELALHWWSLLHNGASWPGVGLAMVVCDVCGVMSLKDISGDHFGQGK